MATLNIAASSLLRAELAQNASRRALCSAARRVPGCTSGASAFVTRQSFSRRSQNSSHAPLTRMATRASASPEGYSGDTVSRPPTTPATPTQLILTLTAAAAAVVITTTRRALSQLQALFFSPLSQSQGAMVQRLKFANAPLASLCFAAIGQGVDSASSSTPLTVIASGMAKWLELYSGLLLIRVLLSWFPNIDWERQPLQAIRDMSDPYLNLFRNIMPPFFGALDLSPMLAFLVLGMLTSLLNTTIS